MKIVVVGTGYVGLVTGACFAETGVTVYCVDIDEKKINLLKKGKIPIYEPGLDSIVERNMEKKRLFFSTSLKDVIDGSDAVFIAVGTPQDEDGSADLKYVLTVAREIGMYLNHYLVVVTKSTVPIGTSEKVRKAVSEELEKRDKHLPFDVASNPEFLKEGNAVDDFLKPDRIVIGVDSEEAKNTMQRLYKPFVLNGHPIIFMDIPSAEMTKYAANSMLATKISFMNDIANLCDRVGADISMVRRGIGSDPRIGDKFLYAGIGYGGSCFPKDVKALIKSAEEHNCSLDILKAVEKVNDRQKEILIDKIKQHFNNQLKGKTFAIWGLSFKPHTDDMREAPSLVIINKLLSEGANCRVYDPVAMEEAKLKLKDKVHFAKDQYDALIDADAMVLVTEWPEFRLPNFELMTKLMRTKVIFDGRNIYEPNDMKDLGFSYYSVGRKNVVLE
jgi:UDPglucose 6-dehydrogenase